MSTESDRLHRIADSFGPAASRWRKIRDMHYYADRLAELTAALCNANDEIERLRTLVRNLGGDLQREVLQKERQ